MLQMDLGPEYGSVDRDRLKKSFQKGEFWATHVFAQFSIPNVVIDRPPAYDFGIFSVLFGLNIRHRAV